MFKRHYIDDIEYPSSPVCGENPIFIKRNLISISPKRLGVFGGDDTVSQHCILNHMLKDDFGIEPKCKKFCSKLEYFGELLLTFPYQSEEKGCENWTVYYIFAIQSTQCGFGSQALERISNL